METPLEIKEKWLETYQKLIDAYVEGHKTLVSEHMRAIFEYSKIAINCSFFLNGGSAVAILYNSNAAAISQKLGILLGYCAFGAMLSALCAGTSYLTQRLYFYYDASKSLEIIQVMFNKKFNLIQNEDQSFELKIKTPKWVHGLSLLSCVLFLSSLASFYYALSQAFPSFKLIPFI